MSHFSGGWHVAMLSVGKQKLRESETAQAIPNRTSPSQSTRDLEGCFPPGFHLGVWTRVQ